MNDYNKTYRRNITRRGVIWLGQTCNLNCHFCYFLDRIKTQSHPEHPFMSLEKAKKICRTLVDVYHNNSIDIQGGEPTIYKDILELVRYCREIGLLPTLITNALVLSNMDVCVKLKEAGLRDLLVSVHGLGATFDTIVGVKGAHEKQMKALDNLIEVGIPFRFNCVLSKMALPQLADIARLAVVKGARVVNFIAFNPFEDQSKAGMRSNDNVPRYSEVAAPLTEALDILETSGVEVNVRYFPFCMVEERHRKSVYNFQQLPYDVHEWDYASWSWTGMRQQRIRDCDISPSLTLAEATYQPDIYPGVIQNFAVWIHHRLQKHSRLLSIAESINKKIGELRRKVGPFSEQQGQKDPAESHYRENARLRAKIHCRYLYADVCHNCSVQSICDGFHGDYAELFGAGEANSIILPTSVSDPKFFIKHQLKVVEADDYDWAL